MAGRPRAVAGDQRISAARILSAVCHWNISHDTQWRRIDSVWVSLRQPVPLLAASEIGSSPLCALLYVAVCRLSLLPTTILHHTHWTCTG